MNDKPRLEPLANQLYSVATIGGPESLSPSADELRALTGVRLPDMVGPTLPIADMVEANVDFAEPSDNGKPQSAMIDLSRTRFIVTAWPDHRWPLEIVRWIEGLMTGVKPEDPNYRASVKKSNVVCARNWAIKNEALGSNSSYEWFVFADRDVRPRPGIETSRFLALNADVKSCQVQHGNPGAYSWPNDFHEPIWCTSRRVLESIKPPWFLQDYNADGTEMDGCICQSFRTKVLKAGFSIAHGGWADHDRDGSWCG